MGGPAAACEVRVPQSAKTGSDCRGTRRRHRGRAPTCQKAGHATVCRHESLSPLSLRTTHVAEARAFTELTEETLSDAVRHGLGGRSRRERAFVHSTLRRTDYDRRRSFDALALATTQLLGEDPRSGAL